jgi:hypothetical protein
MEEVKHTWNVGQFLQDYAASSIPDDSHIFLLTVRTWNLTNFNFNFDFINVWNRYDPVRVILEPGIILQRYLFPAEEDKGRSSITMLVCVSTASSPSVRPPPRPTLRHLPTLSDWFAVKR